MKYFVNYPYTAESLKAEFRELAKKLHPDTGGDAEEFKAMQNEYEQVTNDIQRANEEAEAREEMKRAAEEARRRREEEEREAEEARKAARPLYEKRCNKWAPIMEDLKSYRDAEAAARRDYGWSSAEAKAAGHAFRAARRRNLVAMAKAAFPGVKFTASINTGWGGGATISWNEGPTVEEFKAATDFDLFVSGWDTFDGMTDCAGYEHAMFTEFANNYGQFSGCVSYDRTEEKEHREEVADIICSVKPSAAEQRAKDGRREDCTVFLTDDEITKICSLLGIDADKFKKAHQIYNNYGESRYFELFVEWFTKWSHYTPQPKAPEFTPKYGETYRRIKKALGGNVFGRNKSREILDIFALCDDLAGLEVGKIFMWEGKKEFSHMYSSSRKNDAARVAKMAAVGITLGGDACTIKAVADEVREALRREREDIEQQRKAWEAEQRGEKPAEKADKREKTAKASNSKTDTQKPATAAANGDGLTMEQYSEKATVIRGYDQQQRAELIEMGGRENFRLSGGKGIIFSTRKHGEALAAWFARYSNAEKSGDTDEATQAEPTTDATTDKADATTEPTTTGEGDTLENSAKISALVVAVAEFFGTLARVSREAATWEGVTVPVATLARWKYETEEGTKRTAETFAEVCACLASLTPDNRREFDALGVIFWTLAEQLRNGYDAATIGTATDYARAQLFALIERTQSPQQAAKIREAFESFREAA